MASREPVSPTQELTCGGGSWPNRRLDAAFVMNRLPFVWNGVPGDAMRYRVVELPIHRNKSPFYEFYTVPATFLQGTGVCDMHGDIRVV